MRILKHRKTDRPRAVNRKRHADNAERVKLHVGTGDTVRVVRGDDKGKEGKVIRVYTKTGPRDGRGREHREEASPGPHGRRAERHHRVAGADPRIERDAARSEERRADAHASTDRRRRNQGAHRGEERGSNPASVDR